MNTELHPAAAMALVVASINAWLIITKQGFRVKATDITMTRRDGVLFLAFPETRPHCGRPYSTMAGD